MMDLAWSKLTSAGSPNRGQDGTLLVRAALGLQFLDDGAGLASGVTRRRLPGNAEVDQEGNLRVTGTAARAFDAAAGHVPAHEGVNLMRGVTDLGADQAAGFLFRLQE
jgi:hypothetical protein